MAIYKGSEKVKSLYKGNVQIIKRYKGTNVIYRGLPSAYQEVEYLESTGTQYIDTGVVANINTTYEFATKQTNDMKSKLFGSRISSGQGANAIYFDSSNGFTFNYGNSLSNPDGQFDNVVLKIKTIKDNSFYYFYINDILKWQKAIYNDGFYNGNMLFGSYNNNGTPATASGTGTQTLYYCKIYDNNVLVRNFVPCYRKADNVAGFYDLVNGVFYTNQGTGTFIVGGDV